MKMDLYGQLKPAGPLEWIRRRTPALARTCPFSPSAQDEDSLASARFPDARYQDAKVGRFEAAYVGHVAEGDLRARGSSGGMTTWVARELLRLGLVDAVAHVDGGENGRLFSYRISRSEADIRGGAKSRYYPVELSGVLRAIRAEPGRYAVVGIPCFIKAVHLLCIEDPVLRERIAYTLGLYCGHMKSARMAESFAWQMDARMASVTSLEYRLKDASRPANWYTAQISLRTGETRRKDWWWMADGDWGAGFFQNSACDFCDDVVAETADISFGDAWVEPYSSDGRGTNVVVVRSPLLHQILRSAIADGRLELAEVDGAFVEQTQAAGFRQRREGLAFRLTWARHGVRPRKRVAPGSSGLGPRRRLVYGTRSHISRWSHRVFLLARVAQAPGLYICWARAALAFYGGLAYSRGHVGKLLDRLLPS